jgi:hypothetical protein
MLALPLETTIFLALKISTQTDTGSPPSNPAKNLLSTAATQNPKASEDSSAMNIARLNEDHLLQEYEKTRKVNLKKKASDFSTTPATTKHSRSLKRGGYCPPRLSILNRLSRFQYR